MVDCRSACRTIVNLLGATQKQTAGTPSGAPRRRADMQHFAAGGNPIVRRVGRASDWAVRDGLQRAANERFWDHNGPAPCRRRLASP
jgi:hypothetical protein